MDVESAVETRSGAWTGTIRAQSLDCAVDEFWVSGEVVMVVVGEVGDDPAVVEFCLGARRCVSV